MNTTDALDKAKEIVSHLSDEEKKQLLAWLQSEYEEKHLSYFSFITSHSVLEKEWLNAEEDKAWENL
ncbi:MAG TPA: hypothetical protein VN958_04630 [Chitinophagaceae bacterium]|nr:hypothetical protein [Chitinophagaceae bacterium]